MQLLFPCLIYEQYGASDSSNRRVQCHGGANAGLCYCAGTQLRGRIMMFEHKGRRPTIDPSARVAPNATICGDVSIGPNVSVGFGAVITAESGPVAIGANCVIMDTAVLRGVRGERGFRSTRLT